jgi:putative endonuclease
MTANWSVYLIRCKDCTLYTGISTDVARRFAQHEEGKAAGAKYLRGRGPLTLVFQKQVGDKNLAMIIENKIKKLSRIEKEELIQMPDIVDEIIKDSYNV